MNTDKTYTFTGETNVVRIEKLNIVLNRIQALVDIPEWDVKAGDVGGWIEFEDNLMHDGSWVADDGIVARKANVRGKSLVKGTAKVVGEAILCRKSIAGGNCYISGEALIGNTTVSSNATIQDNVGVSNSKIGASVVITNHVFIENSSIVIENGRIQDKVKIIDSKVHGTNYTILGEVEISRSTIGRDKSRKSVYLAGYAKITDCYISSIESVTVKDFAILEFTEILGHAIYICDHANVKGKSSKALVKIGLNTRISDFARIKNQSDRPYNIRSCHIQDDTELIKR